MFDTIAPRYDLLNRVMTLGRDVAWRRRAVEELALPRDAKVADLACGTGDLCRELQQQGYEAVGFDLSAGMLAAARTAAPLVRADVLTLPSADASFDGATCGLAVRNFIAIEPFLASVARIVRPGGRVAILEVSEPQNRLWRLGHRIYFNRIVPRVGALLSNGDAYRYLPASAAYLPTADLLHRMIEAAGFSNIRRSSMGLGAIQLFTATRCSTPGPRDGQLT